jgi:hypothetical protein
LDPLPLVQRPRGRRGSFWGKRAAKEGVPIL